MLLFKKTASTGLDVTQAVDEIQAAVYSTLKAYGFKKYGRTLHRFVSGDISQVIHFQTGLPVWGMHGLMCVNIGIRVPECADRVFQPEIPLKKYYHEYDCNIRSRIGTVSGHKEVWFDLKKGNKKAIRKILKEIKQTVLPTFDVLCSREAILEHRRDYPLFDTINNHLILLEECMIHGHLGDMQTAKELFEEYYQNALDKYSDAVKNGRKHYLKKGERITYMGQEICAKRNGYVTLYGASHAHIDYLDALAFKLNLR